MQCCNASQRDAYTACTHLQHLSYALILKGFANLFAPGVLERMLRCLTTVLLNIFHF